MKCYKNLLIIKAFFLIGFMVSSVAVSHLAAQDKAEKQAADELVVENSSGETLADEESVTKKKKKDESFLIQVTAQKRKQSIQDVPGSVSALNVKQIEDAGISSTNEIHDYVPNFSSFSNGSGFSYYSIRGQSNLIQYSNSVGIYVDDVPLVLSGNVTDSGLYEIERIEVLRGAQGNLYGLNSAGGVINIVTKKPDNFWAAKAEGSCGNYNMRGYKASVSGPLVKDNLYMGFSGMYNIRDSFMDEKGADTHKHITMAGSYQLRWTPVKELDVLFTANLDNREQDYAPYSMIDDDPWEILNKGMTEKCNNKGDVESLRIRYSAPLFEVTSITGRSANKFEYDASNDLTSGGANLFFALYEEKSSSWVEELRFNSTDKKSPLQWIAGAFYLNTENKIDGNYPVDTGMFAAPYTPSGTYADDKTNSKVKSSTTSVFSQAGYTLFERFTITGGIRYDYDRREINFFRNQFGTVAGDFNDSTSWHVFSPRISIDFRAHDSVMTYVSAARGYKAGGYAPLNVSSADNASFDPEYSWTFEGGVKTNWWKNRIIANIAGFYSIVDDLQTIVLSPATMTQILKNTAKAQNSGVEVEVTTRPFSGFEIMGSFGYLFSEFKKHETKELEGNKVPYAPEYQAGLMVQYTSPQGVFVRGESNWKGRTYFDEGNSNKQDGYMILNARLGYKAEHFNFSFFINNALNEEYYTGIWTWTAGGDKAGTLGAPRTFGVQVALEF